MKIVLRNFSSKNEDDWENSRSKSYKSVDLLAASLPYIKWNIISMPTPKHRKLKDEWTVEITN